ncbi:NB-ARC domain-containing protein [Streptomyces sp. H27-D2]|uniref:NB-ARC domain-containing protein n=1 Tax=Streptomyces sp. H27-D2 TaxID=3046304 RepID=UPI002DBF3039|nr:NB-ARC domain-containing protein [Streptomyces sp. H27-D2]MEC4015259.1 NB-ARC domain-containing protein [Streptomyces sp. H27-D2]
MPHVRNELSGNVNGPSVQAQQIHGGITFNVQLPPPSGPETKPDQVPSLTVRFINRSADLSVLDGWFGGGNDSPPVGLGALNGLPGVGKTAIVSRWAEKSRALFPDGQIYVDFAPLRDGAGGDTSEAVGMCLRALGVSDTNIPGALAERVKLFRSRSADRRLLIVLDGVNQPAQVRSLVPKGAGSVLLVTSNGRLNELAALDGARMMSLGPLDMDGGLRVLADRCGEAAVAAERPAAERLVESCGGLPVALHVVAARLLTNRRLTLTALAAELADETGRLNGMSLHGEHSVSAVLGLAYNDLPHDAARLYRLLGWLPGRTFDVGTAAVAADIDTATAESLLNVLEAASLLDVTEDGRFRFHDLVRLHAGERAAEEEPATEQQLLTTRVVTHYLVLTALADRAVREDRLRIADLSGPLRDAPDPFAAGGGPPPLAWLEAERANILAVLRAAARHGLHTPVWQLAEGFTVLFLHHRHLGNWKESLELGAAAAAEAVAPAAEARLRSLLSRPLMDLGEYDRARAELESAVACAEVSGHPALGASVQEFFGRYWDRFDPFRATAAYRRSIELNIEAGEWRGVAIATYFLGCAQDAEGDHGKALETLRKAHQDLTACEDPRMAARATAAIGVVHEHLGDPDEAMRTLAEAARVLRAQRASHYEAQALVRLADLTERTGGRRDAVREHLAMALEIYEAGGSPEAETLRGRLEGLDLLERLDETSQGDAAG